LEDVTKPCGVPLTKNRYGEPDEDGPRCHYHRKPRHVKCQFHWLLRQPIEVQVKAAITRESLSEGLPHRARMRPEECPEGERWCAGCQSFIPLFYVQGSRCRACNSRAAHASHIKRTYDLEPAEYDRLLEWQGGVCYICGQTPRVRRLAVDHDHRTGEVRGLLCANDEHGCNVVLRRLLNDVEMARRALAYVERGPLTRMRHGEAGRPKPDPRPYWARTAASQPPAQSLESWDPFGEQSA
jgi:hypothetical protein